MLSADQRMRLNASRRQWAIVVGMAISLIVLFLALNRLAPGGRPVAGIRGVDPAGYFAAAHSILFDHDLDLSNEYARVPPDTPNRYTGIRKETGLPGNPWPIGYPLLSIPFLAFGSAVDRVAGHAPDGYSHFAVLFYSLTNVVLTGAGLILLFGFLRKSSELFADRYSSEFRGWISVFVAGVTLMGTTVFYYALSPMSHASTFLMASLFLRLWWQARRSDGIGIWAALGCAGGALSICRWQELIYLVGPILFDMGNLRTIWRKPGGIASWTRSRTAYALAVAVCWIPQVVEWKIIYGKFFTNPQGSGFMEFPPRFVLNVLFSSQHGWFISTPVVLLGVIGLLLGTRVSPAHYWPWIAVVGLEVSVMGSLAGKWRIDDTFGQRPLTSLAPLLAYGFATALYLANRWQRRALAAAAALCAIYTVLFAVQFRMNLVPRTERLTFAELITDKVRLDRSYHRKESVTRAEQLRAAGNPAGARSVLQDAIRDYGEDRFLLEALVRTDRDLSDTAAAEAHERRLDALLSHRFW